MKDLIDAIETLAQTAFDEPRGVDTICRSDVIDLINTHMAGKVIIPDWPKDVDTARNLGFEVVTYNLYTMAPSSLRKNGIEFFIDEYKAMITIGEQE